MSNAHLLARNYRDINANGDSHASMHAASWLHRHFVYRSGYGEAARNHGLLDGVVFHVHGPTYGGYSRRDLPGDRGVGLLHLGW